jgi:hypothetical protein
MKQLILITVLCTTLASCASVGGRVAATGHESRAERRQQRKCEKATEKWGCEWGIVTDTAYILQTREITRDTTITITIPGESRVDSVFVASEIEVQRLTARTQYARAVAWVENNHLRLEIIQDLIAVQRTIEKAIRETSTAEQKTKTITIKEPYPVVTNHMNTFQRIFFWIGALVTLSLVIYYGARILIKKYILPRL